MENKKTTEIKTPDIQDNQRYWDALADKINKTYQDVNASTVTNGVCIIFDEDWYNKETLQRNYICTIKNDIELIALMNKMVRVPSYDFEKEKIKTWVLPKRIEENYSLPTQKLIAMGCKKLCLMFGLDLAEDVLAPLMRAELLDVDEYRLTETEAETGKQDYYILHFDYAYGACETSETDTGISFNCWATIYYYWEKDHDSIDIDDPEYVAKIPSAVKCGKFENRITIEEYILCQIGLIGYGLKKDEINGREDDLLDKFHELEKECMSWAESVAEEQTEKSFCSDDGEHSYEITDVEHLQEVRNRQDRETKNNEHGGQQTAPQQENNKPNQLLKEKKNNELEKVT